VRAGPYRGGAWLLTHVRYPTARVTESSAAAKISNLQTSGGYELSTTWRRAASSPDAQGGRFFERGATILRP
jgi:hypothetical protein